MRERESVCVLDSLCFLRCPCEKTSFFHPCDANVYSAMEVFMHITNYHDMIIMRIEFLRLKNFVLVVAIFRTRVTSVER